MKLWFVHEIDKAKDNNPNFAGQTLECYIGKEGRVYLNNEMERGICTGWKRKHFAEKYAEWCRTEGHKYDEEYWDIVKIEVVEMEGIE